MAAHFKPQELHDVYRENVEKMIEQKQKGQYRRGRAMGRARA